MTSKPGQEAPVGVRVQSSRRGEWRTWISLTAILAGASAALVVPWVARTASDATIDGGDLYTSDVVRTQAGFVVLLTTLIVVTLSVAALFAVGPVRVAAIGAGAAALVPGIILVTHPLNLNVFVFGQAFGVANDMVVQAPPPNHQRCTRRPAVTYGSEPWPSRSSAPRSHDRGQRRTSR